MNVRQQRVNRRSFLAGAAGGAAVAMVIPRHVLGAPRRPGANEKINVAGIGIAGQGWGNIQNFGGENIVALCDVDEGRAGQAVQRFGQAKFYRDGRKMLDEMDKQIDAVVVSTPDHTHAVHVMGAIRRDKHVYCEKPLAHSVGECRALEKAAKDRKVVTQLGNQGHSSGSIRTFCEWIWDGAIGNVKEIHACCDAFPGLYSQIGNLAKIGEKHEVPKSLDWDLWLGPAQWRDYHPMWCHWNWRGWSAFGTGAIGDWWCHVVDPVFWALDLGAPKTVLAEADDWDPKTQGETFPKGTVVTYEFPAKDKRGPVTLKWFDGAARPPRPADLEADRNPPGVGAIVLGDRGTITYGSHGAGGVRIVPETKMRDYQRPAETIPRVPGHHRDWVDAIREGRDAGSNFGYGAPLTEAALLGAVAIRFPGRKLEWDAAAMRFTNLAEANAYVNPPYREGWKL
jgi:predicted dehydrogenase